MKEMKSHINVYPLRVRIEKPEQLDISNPEFPAFRDGVMQTGQRIVRLEIPVSMVQTFPESPLHRWMEVSDLLSRSTEVLYYITSEKGNSIYFILTPKPIQFITPEP
jgi:hypothetical protein